MSRSVGAPKSTPKNAATSPEIGSISQNETVIDSDLARGIGNVSQTASIRDAFSSWGLAFKKLCEKEGLTKDIKRKEFYEKPSERRRRAMRKSQVRRIKTEMGPLAKPEKPEKRPPRD